MINHIQGLFQEKIKIWHIVCLFLFAQLIYLVMMTYTFPIIQQNSGTMKAMDLMSMGYSYDYVQAFLATLSPTSLNTYLFFQLPLDILFPLATSLTFSMIIAKTTPLGNKLFLVGFIPMLFDYLENSCILIMLTSNQITHSLVSLSSFFTLMKSVTTMIMYLLITILLILFFKNNKTKNPLDKSC
ncbi:hypothetical protein DOK76_01620 [Vagococcus sp. DIV0080]|uniref:Uncharacterized protein n=1 Tax=Candidatus Vagococcus giribetii TaxID=2230876 RepID=A0ABS3HPS9_9ENTE|nr:hypothetical protein [Vagococcus sp. DIV0080]MBO0475748.1 hypothetical protein [Vagococcus sp. DIV0080]